MPLPVTAHDLLDQLRAAPGLIYAYTAVLDNAAHVFGIGSAEWHAAGAHVDALLTRLVEALPPDAALLITADHGESLFDDGFLGHGRIVRAGNTALDMVAAALKRALWTT